MKFGIVGYKGRMGNEVKLLFEEKGTNLFGDMIKMESIFHRPPLN